MDFSSLQPVDSDGVPIAAYMLSFNRGSVLDPGSWGGATFLDILFGLYKVVAWFSLMLLNVVSSFDWLSPFVKLLERVSDTITGTLGAIGVFAMALGVMLAVAAVNWMRRTNHRTLYQLGLTVVFIMVAITMVSPVRFAGEMLGVGRDLGAQVGTTAAQTPDSATLSMILADKLVREPTQRWNFGRDLDSLGCGPAWSSKVRAGDQDKIKDAALACPGGQALHYYAMHPTNAIYDGFFALGCILVFAVFCAALMVRMLRTGFATVLHASVVKPMTPFLPASPAIQNLFAQNALAIGLGGCTLFAEVIIFIAGAAFTAGMAVLTGSGAEASIITAGAMIGLVLGTRQFGKNIQGQRRQIASRITHSSAVAPLAGTTLPATHLARQLLADRALHGLAPRVLTDSSHGRGRVTQAASSTRLPTRSQSGSTAAAIPPVVAAGRAAAMAAMTSFLPTSAATAATAATKLATRPRRPPVSPSPAAAPAGAHQLNPSSGGRPPLTAPAAPVFASSPVSTSQFTAALPHSWGTQIPAARAAETAHTAPSQKPHQATASQSAQPRSGRTEGHRDPISPPPYTPAHAAAPRTPPPPAPPVPPDAADTAARSANAAHEPRPPAADL